MSRVILHSDCDNFYASIECAKQPKYWDVPLVVAGSKEKRSGIVLAKNQIAKGFGIKTGDVLFEAMRKCPDIITVPPCFDDYVRYSKMVKEIYHSYTSQVESFGLDECFLDVTGSQNLFGTGEEIARKISDRVKKELKITVTIGVSYNKMFAKIASDLKKPDAINVVTKDNYKDIIWSLPAERLLYVGKSSKKVLNSRGIFTIGEIANTDPELLTNMLGKRGIEFYINANGQDNSVVKNIGYERDIKSIGNGTTTAKDLLTRDEVSKVLLMLSESVASRLRQEKLFCSVIAISIRYSDLTSIERQKTLNFTCNTAHKIHQIGMEIFDENPDSRGIRALSIRTSSFEKKKSGQLSFLEDVKTEEKMQDVEKSIDKIRNKFGWSAIKRASLLEEKEAKNLNPDDDNSLNSVAFKIDR